jgi:hypothetical protein
MRRCAAMYILIFLIFLLYTLPPTHPPTHTDTHTDLKTLDGARVDEAKLPLIEPP